jgi:hypothetical protein
VLSAIDLKWCLLGLRGSSVKNVYFYYGVQMPKTFVLLLEILLCLGVWSWDFALVLHYAYTIYPYLQLELISALNGLDF